MWRQFCWIRCWMPHWLPPMVKTWMLLRSSPKQLISIPCIITWCSWISCSNSLGATVPDEGHSPVQSGEVASETDHYIALYGCILHICYKLWHEKSGTYPHNLTLHHDPERMGCAKQLRQFGLWHLHHCHAIHLRCGLA